MSNIRAITGSSKIVYRNQGGGSKKQGIASSTNLSMWSHVAFRNHNVVCPCHRHHVFCMNQLGGVGAGGVPGRSYMFAPRADGVSKNKILCGINHKNIRHPSQFELIYSEPVGGTSNPLQISFVTNKLESYINTWRHENYPGDGGASYSFITKCYNSGSGNGSDISCYKKYVVGHTYTVYFTHKATDYNVVFLITDYNYSPDGGRLTIKFLNNPSKDLLNHILPSQDKLNIIKAYKSTYKVTV